MIDAEIIKIENKQIVYSDWEDNFIEIKLKVKYKTYPYQPSDPTRDWWKNEQFNDPDNQELLDTYTEQMSQYYTEIEDKEYQEELLQKLHLGKTKLFQLKILEE